MKRRNIFRNKEGMNNMYYVLSFVAGVLVAIASYANIIKLFRVQENRQERAICEEFRCRKNDFTYFWSGEDDFYIVTVQGKEYHVKFSQNNPLKVVYRQELDTIHQG